MTKKRFVPIFDGFDKRVVGAKDNGVIISFMDMFDLLNELHEEKEELKLDNELLLTEMKDIRDKLTLYLQVKGYEWLKND